MQYVWHDNKIFFGGVIVFLQNKCPFRGPHNVSNSYMGRVVLFHQFIEILRLLISGRISGICA
jgi:hypothetical protein